KIGRIQDNVVIAEGVVLVEAHGSGRRSSGGGDPGYKSNFGGECTMPPSRGGVCVLQRRGSVAEELPALDRFDDGLRYHAFPGGVIGLEAAQDIAGEDVEDVRIEAHDAVDVVIFHQVRVQVAQALADLEIPRGDEDVGGEVGHVRLA